MGVVETSIVCYNNTNNRKETTMAETLTKTQLIEKMAECHKHAQNKYSAHCFAYAAEENLIEELLCDLEDGETIEYDDTQWLEYAENLLEDHIGFIYEDWYKGKVEENCYSWMLFAAYNDVYLSDTHMAEESIKMGWELPEWYKKEYCD